MKLVIYKQGGKLKVTPEDNYGYWIQDARKIQDASAFGSPQEVIEYYCTWFGNSKDDFIVKC
jgi:hypothetical protein